LETAWGGGSERSFAKILNISGQGFLSKREHLLVRASSQRGIISQRPSCLKIISLKSLDMAYCS
jgi:hypothetical protein